MLERVATLLGFLASGTCELSEVEGLFLGPLPVAGRVMLVDGGGVAGCLLAFFDALLVMVFLTGTFFRTATVFLTPTLAAG